MSLQPNIRWRMLWRRFLLPTLCLAAPLGLVRRTAADWNYVFSNSMSPSIEVGDCILVNKLAYDLQFPWIGLRVQRQAQPSIGDVVVLRAPDDGERLVKRIVGVPGDVVEIRAGELFVNGASVNGGSATDGTADGDYRTMCETLGGRTHRVMFCADRPGQRTIGPVTLKPDQYFVLGDNRDASVDSRSFGAVARDQILGRVVGVTLAFQTTKHFAPAWDRSFRRVL
jgi:signal peptidase I